ncbi:MAG: penicillin-binding protein 2 [Gammaproteobacteria bacterium]|nr:penicillin-binding protein 2 [Gammaproteobacteria bacterium]
MDPRITFKDQLRNPVRETRLLRHRMIAALAFTVLLVFIVVGRLVHLQVFNHAHYSTLSQNNQISIVALPPARGLIYDRNGVLLAQNTPSFGLEVIPEQVQNLNATLTALKEIIAISDADIKRFQRLRGQKRYSKGVPLRLRLSEEEVARFAVNRPRFPGVDITAGAVRYYPLGALAAHAVGYVARISEVELAELDPIRYGGVNHIGKTGVEKAYEDALHGTVGFEQVETNAQGRLLRVLERHPPVAGKNLHLSIDIQLQSIAAIALGDHRGAVVALDPTNGAVLALVSQPAYDPNLFVNGIDSKDYDALRNSPDQPLYNRALRGQYPPGSTIKPFIGLGGLELGVINETQDTFCPGWFSLKGQSHRYRDWNPKGHGSVDLDRAIVESCDVYFYTLATILGIDRLHDFLGQFGFGQKTGIDIGGELAGLVPSAKWKRRAHRQPWYPGETVITGIGQGYNLATPLQLAVATGALANSGTRIAPRVVAEIKNPVTQQLYPQAAPVTYTIPVKDKRHWDNVITAMTRVVSSERGTARAIGLNAPYTIAGKTGTAQVFGIKQGEKYIQSEVDLRLRDHALFIAFAPVEHPRIALAVLVENGGHGGSVAAPIARKVMDQYLLSQPPAQPVDLSNVVPELDE